MCFCSLHYPLPSFFRYFWAGLDPQVHTDTFYLGLLHLFCRDSLSEKEILLQAALAAALGTLLRFLLQHPQINPFFLPSPPTSTVNVPCSQTQVKGFAQHSGCFTADKGQLELPIPPEDAAMVNAGQGTGQPRLPQAPHGSLPSSLQAQGLLLFALWPLPSSAGSLASTPWRKEQFCLVSSRFWEESRCWGIWQQQFFL